MNTPYTKGLYEVADGHYAYLQPDGSWGYSNAGLVVDGDQSLLIDTLFDELLTAEMLSDMKRMAGFGGSDIQTVVNTHANGDHTYGNALVTNAEIISSVASAHEMDETPPEQMAGIMAMAPQMGELGEFFLEKFNAFHFEGIALTPPTRTFSGKLTLPVGNKSVDLIEVGPAHTGGDVLAYVAADKIIYTGDILFIDGTPIMWAGPVDNWINACNLIIDLDVDIIVPGHGPLTDKPGVERMRGYLEWVKVESRKRFDAGMNAYDAAMDISHPEYDQWGDSERIMVNVDRMYKEFDPSHISPDVPTMFALMAARDKANKSR